MSLNQIFACSLIMKELFGEVVEKVGTYLIKKGPMPRGLIVQDTELNVEQVSLHIMWCYLDLAGGGTRSGTPRGGYPDPPGGVPGQVPPPGGYPDPPSPPVDRQTPVKTVPSRRTTYAGGNNKFFV